MAFPIIIVIVMTQIFGQGLGSCVYCFLNRLVLAIKLSTTVALIQVKSKSKKGRIRHVEMSEKGHQLEERHKQNLELEHKR